MKPLLEFSGVTFTYQGDALFDRAVLSIAENDKVALVGANGAGKTTLLKLAAGLLRPTQGKVLLQGRDLGTISRRDLAKRIAFVPQHMAAPFDFTVQQIVEQGRTPHLGWLGGFRPPDREAVEQAMEFTAVAHLRRRIFNQLSGGEQQRVRIAIALAQQTRLLLLDEPTQHLDIGRQAEILELLQKLHREGATIVAAMHDLHTVRSTFDSVILLHPDRRIVQGGAAEILRRETIEQAFAMKFATEPPSFSIAAP